MKTPRIVTPQEWEAARQQLLVKEKKLTRARDALAAERRRMTWLAVDRLRVRRAHGPREPARPVRGSPSTDRLPRLLRTRRIGLAPTTPASAAPWWPTRSPTNAFIRGGDRVFRTYFINSRGDEALGGIWSYLDMTVDALGRQEEWEDSPEGYPQTASYEWWNWHDEYGNAEPQPSQPARARLGPDPS